MQSLHNRTLFQILMKLQKLNLWPSYICKQLNRCVYNNYISILIKILWTNFWEMQFKVDIHILCRFWCPFFTFIDLFHKFLIDFYLWNYKCYICYIQSSTSSKCIENFIKIQNDIQSCILVSCILHSKTVKAQNFFIS